MCTKLSATEKPLKHDLITCFWMLLDFSVKGDKKGTRIPQMLIHSYHLCPVEAFVLTGER
ncbi:hypothetical protein DB330_14080 [Lacticaseibacillus casei]|nr:hypothetical protein [Lacticaseibacillus casei]PTU90341.1 hypothetical protein DB330_14080 [Lacticaseibacillus casei]PTU91612.1 hypothetical protein DB326_12985 [Lacticaseibacillus casei]